MMSRCHGMSQKKDVRDMSYVRSRTLKGLKLNVGIFQNFCIVFPTCPISYNFIISQPKKEKNQKTPNSGSNLKSGLG